MKNITLYILFMLTPTFLSPLPAQEHHIENVSWHIAAQLPATAGHTVSIGVAGAVSGSVHQLLLVAGGTNFPAGMPWNGGKKEYHNEIFLYGKQGGQLILKPSLKPLKLPFNLAYAAVCSTSNGIVVAGGENESGLSKKVLLLHWKADELEISYLPDLPVGLTNAALTQIGNILYLAGGETDNGATTQFLCFNPAAPAKGWVRVTDLPLPVSHMVLLSSGDNQIFLIGGRKSNKGSISTIYDQVFSYSIAQQQWTEKQSLPYPLSAASGVAVGKDLLLISGDRGKTFHQAEQLIAEMNSEQDPVKKEVLNQKKIEVQSAHPGFSREVLKYDPSGNRWLKLKGTLPYGTVTTTAVISGDNIMIAGGEIRAGVRTPDILTGKIKFEK